MNRHGHAMPATLLHATSALRQDEVVLASIGGDRAIGEYYAKAKEEEFLSWHSGNKYD